MIHLIEQWAKGLFILLIGISFLEILIPSSPISRFVHYVFSLIVLASILLPLASGLEEENWVALSPLSSIPEEAGVYQTKETQKEMERVQTKQVTEVYREKTERAIEESLLLEFPGISRLQVIVYIEEDVTKKSFGQMEKVTIKVRSSEVAGAITQYVSNQFQLAKWRISVEEEKEEEHEITGFEK